MEASTTVLPLSLYAYRIIYEICRKVLNVTCICICALYIAVPNAEILNIRTKMRSVNISSYTQFLRFRPIPDVKNPSESSCCCCSSATAKLVIACWICTNPSAIYVYIRHPYTHRHWAHLLTRTQTAHTFNIRTLACTIVSSFICKVNKRIGWSDGYYIVELLFFVRFRFALLACLLTYCLSLVIRQEHYTYA